MLLLDGFTTNMIYYNNGTGVIGIRELKPTIFLIRDSSGSIRLNESCSYLDNFINTWGQIYEALSYELSQ